PGSFLGLGTPVLPPLPMHGGDRNRTSPFAFTGNKFEFRALGSSQSLALPNTVLNTIVAEAIDELADKLERSGDAELEGRLRPILQRSYASNKQIVFGGDNYSEEWHEEAEQRGLLNLRTTPDALPQLLEPSTVQVFSRYGVLSDRELESREEVYTEQYAVKLNIEAETAANMGRTLILPAALRHLGMLREAGVEALTTAFEELVNEFNFALEKLEGVNDTDDDISGDPHRWAAYIRDEVVPAMADLREIGDRLEKAVADDLWPLPKYSEMLFVK
ncbi:MAG TPA: glutamine synthetase type III, partial [Solirubrobacteraceae bacterium]